MASPELVNYQFELEKAQNRQAIANAMSADDVAFLENVLLEGDPYKIESYYNGQFEIDYDDIGGHR